MSMRIRLKDNKKISINDKKQEYIRPDYIYIPLISHGNTNCEMLVKVGDTVKKGTAIAQRVNDAFPILSSISGVIDSIVDMLYINGDMVKTVVIKNDFKEKTLRVNTLNEDISKISREEFIERLKKNGVSGLSGNDFSTYIKYSTEDKLNILVVNGVECEPYITADYAVMKNHSEEILETVDAIMSIMNLERAVISFKDEFKELKVAFDSIAGTYPNIDIMTVKDYYPAGWERNLISDVLHLKYKNRPSEVGVVVSNVSTIYEIYQVLKYNKPLTEKYITITGNAINEPQNILVKIGSKVSDIITAIGGYNEEDNIIVLTGGPMMGKSISSLQTLVVKPLTGIIVNKYVKEVATECMKCGKCVEACPVNLSPVLISKSLKNKKELKKLKCDKCIHCGLCSYICPAKIDVREKVEAGISEVLK